MKDYTVAIVGATGAVGQEIASILAERNFPVSTLVPLASKRSAGKKIVFRGKEYTVQETLPSSFAGVDLAFFCAGTKVSRELAPEAAKAGCVVIDNSNAFRMDPEVPLVVPEVNPEDMEGHKGIIANPNCSTIQMVVVLKPLHDFKPIKRVVVSTYQAVSGTGLEAMEELTQQCKDILAGNQTRAEVYPYQIAFNILPHIDVFDETGYTLEEWKMVRETKKIMGDESIAVTATTVRVPVYRSHSEAINIETEGKITPAQAREILAQAPGVEVVDAPEELQYPLPLLAAGKDEVFVGRIREDFTISNGLNLWVVADNLRKGAALNAVQIAETLVEKGLV
ncbi:MAG: aspartate-semialdehyde dehydrogenase [bacterium]|jgi:aspartate-semialdehyde dehydrogenase|nr:aspartate-semialdehyde dehydrogenase [Bacillota bacterium]HHW55376.1 aspartate-semialdehyde dehydrogenase [Bacillota bacterium]